MIEVYIAMTLLSMGYILSQNKGNNVEEGMTDKTVSTNEIPSQKNAYESNFHDTAKKIEFQQGQDKYKRSDQGGLMPNNMIPGSVTLPPVVSKNYGDQKQQQVQTLAGTKISANEFVHNNMVPFFSGRPKQNVDTNVFDTKIEQFTGESPFYYPKRETKPFFKPQKDVSYVHGAPHNVDFMQERIPAPVRHHNVLPFKQERVGPGIKAGYGTQPKGGLHQLEVQEVAKPKTVDELRTKNNPKVTYKGQILPGMKGRRAPVMGKMSKNRPERFYKNTPDMYFKTTGAFFKPRVKSKVNTKETNRQNTSSSTYTGGAFDKLKQFILPGQYRESRKRGLMALNKGPVTLINKFEGQNTDYGTSKIVLHPTHRTTYTQNMHKGNVMSAFRAAMAPIQDAMRATKKQRFIRNTRPEGYLKGPQKGVVYDPNNVPRTTIKQTTLAPTERMNLRGATKPIVYDPDDVARTTVKETTLHEAPPTNLKGNTKGVVYDPDNVARTTIKETTLTPGERMNLKGENKLMVYDPDDIARPTIKETTLREVDPANLKGINKSIVYDPENIARTTIKETTLTEQERLNLRAGTKGVVYDPDDKARTTIKETTLAEADPANLKGNAKGVVYDPDDTARTTIKETTLAEGERMNVNGPKKLTVYDPDEVARTTIKETTLVETPAGNLRAPDMAGHVFDPNDLPRETIRQTLDEIDRALNLKPGFTASIVYDPEDTPRETQKESYTDHEYMGVVYDVLRKVGEMANYHVKETNKQYLSDNEYMGNVHGSEGDGYKIAPKDLRDTVRQVLSDHEYFGGVKDNIKQNEIQYDTIKKGVTRTIRDMHQHESGKRGPVEEGPKKTVGSNEVPRRMKKAGKSSLEDNIKLSQRQIEQGLKQKPPIHLTSNEILQHQVVNHKKPDYSCVSSNRLENDSANMKEQLKTNPYIKSIV